MEDFKIELEKNNSEPVFINTVCKRYNVVGGKIYLITNDFKKMKKELIK